MDRENRVALVQTTDLLVDLENDGTSVTGGRTIKPSAELGKAGPVEKLETERRSRAAPGTDWGVVTLLATELEICPKQACRDSAR